MSADGRPLPGTLIRAARHARGLTLEELSARSGVGLRTISDLERNRIRRPHRRTIDALAEALGLPAAERDGIWAAARLAPPRTTPAPPPAVVPAQLPADCPTFSGRADDVAALLALAATARDEGAAGIAVVVGMPGIGKTTFAVQCARLLAAEFPDGQLCLNLNGFAGRGPAVTTARALQYLLEAFGVPAQHAPVQVEARAALFRSLVAHRRVLLLLDNARDAAQVRPLLPGSAGCFTIVTSRDALTGLVALDNAGPIPLSPLPERDSRVFLSRRLGADRLAGEPAAVADLVDACAGLPLALAIVAARAAGRPGFAMSAIAGELRRRDGSLSSLDRLGRDIGPTTFFSWSYESLSPAAARLFRLLGLVAAPSFAIAAAARLAGLDDLAAGSLLHELAGAHLLTEVTPGRFAFHDLLREYATELAAAGVSAQDRHGALSRLVEQYYRDRVTEATGLAYGQPPAPAPYFAGRDEAMGWLAAEADALIAVIALARAEGLAGAAVRLACDVETYFEMAGRREERATVLHQAVAAARDIGDTGARARCERRLGLAEQELGRHEQARERLELSVRLAEREGGPEDRAEAHRFLSHVLGTMNCLAEALPYAERAVDLYRQLDRRGYANALNSLGYLHAKLGNYAVARRRCGEALDAVGEGPEFLRTRAAILDSLAFIDQLEGQLVPAAAFYRQAAQLREEAGDRHRRAASLLGLAEVLAAAGDAAQAVHVRSEALVILQELRHPDAAQVRALIAAA